MFRYVEEKFTETAIILILIKVCLRWFLLSFYKAAHLTAPFLLLGR